MLLTLPTTYASKQEEKNIQMDASKVSNDTLVLKNWSDLPGNYVLALAGSISCHNYGTGHLRGMWQAIAAV